MPLSSEVANDSPVTPRARTIAAHEDRPAERIDPLLDPRWAELVRAAPAATAFHHPAWLALLARQYGYELFACCLTDPDGRIRAGLPLALVKSRLTGTRLVSLPFSDLVPPLYRTEDRQQLDGALASALHAEHARLRVDLDLHAPWPSLNCSYQSDSFWHHTVPLERSFEELQHGFAHARRAGVKKALREGVLIRLGTDRAALDAFYRLHLQTRHRQGVPTQSKRFIRAYAELFAQALGFVMLAELGGRVIAGGVFLTWNGTLTYKYGASDWGYRAKRPNNLLIAEAIRHGCEHGVHTFDFGRTDLDNPGLRSFKLKWGAEERQLAYTKVSWDNKTRFVPKPSGLQRAAIRHTPPAFGRLVGKVLYRHFA